MEKITLLALVTIILTACGGGGGGGGGGSSSTGSSIAPNPLIGVAASGAPLANTPVIITATSTLGAPLGAPVVCASTTTDAQGNFSTDISGCPSNSFLVLSATDSTGHLLLSTYNSYMLPSGPYANITPLTTITLAAGGATNVNTALTSINSALYALEAQGISPALAQIQIVADLAGFQVTPKYAMAEAAASVMTWATWNASDLFTTQFTANHSGIDAALDSITLSGGNGLPLVLTDLAGNPLVQPAGTSFTLTNAYAALVLPTAIGNAISQAMINPTTLQTPVPRTYTGLMTGSNGSGTCSLVISMSGTATPGTASGTCTSPATGTVALNGTVTNNGQTSLSNGVITFTGGVTAMGGSGTWVSSTKSGTWQIH